MIRWEGSNRQGGDVGHDSRQGGNPRVMVPSMGGLCHIQFALKHIQSNSHV